MDLFFHFISDNITTLVVGVGLILFTAFKVGQGFERLYELDLEKLKVKTETLLKKLWSDTNRQLPEGRSFKEKHIETLVLIRNLIFLTQNLFYVGGYNIIMTLTLVNNWGLAHELVISWEGVTLNPTSVKVPEPNSMLFVLIRLFFYLLINIIIVSNWYRGLTQKSQGASPLFLIVLLIVRRLVETLTLYTCGHLYLFLLVLCNNAGVFMFFKLDRKKVTVFPYLPSSIETTDIPSSIETTDIPPIPSPLDQFEIIPLMDIQMGDLYFSFTNSSLFMLLTICFFLLLVHLVTKKGGLKLDVVQY